MGNFGVLDAIWVVTQLRICNLLVELSNLLAVAFAILFQFYYIL